MSGIASVLV